MVSTSIIRIGPSDGSGDISAKLLRNALVSFFEKQSLSSSSSSSSNPAEATTTTTTTKPSPSSSSCLSETYGRLTISNKYFTANVSIEDLEAELKTQEVLSKEDGVILVFDALHSNPDRSDGRRDGGCHAASWSSSSSSFDALSFAHQQAEEKGTCGDLLRLCVGVSLSSLSPFEVRGKDHEKEYSRRILWCLDHGYEYVEADLSQEGQGKGHDERDKEGFARIVEAIQGTVWSSAVMSKTKQQELKAEYKADTATVEETTQREENPYEPPDPSKFARQANNDTIAKQIMSEESNSESGLLLEPEKAGPEEMEALRRDAEQEHLFERMEGVLREASRIREASKSGLLSDDERRERAGDAAMALMNLMNAFGLEGDEKSEASLSDDNDSGVAEN